MLAKVTDRWCTPIDVAKDLGRFDVDPCTNIYSHILADTEYMLERGQDGLRLPWFGRVFINPPYSDPLPWIARALKHPNCGFVFLLKFDSTTRWFRLLGNGPCRIYPFRRRIKFERPRKVSIIPPWPCMLATMHRHELSRGMQDRVWSLKTTFEKEQ